MRQVSLAFGIITIKGMLIGFIPCFGWFNWINLPLAIIGIITGLLAYTMQPQTSNPYGAPQQRKIPVGLLLCSVAFVFGTLRLILGRGIL